MPVDDRQARFIRKVTHDLRAPVAVARTLLSVLSQELVGPLNPAQADLVERADRKLALLLALVDDLVDLAMARTGAIPPANRRPLALGRFVEQACARFEGAAREKQVDLLYRPLSESMAAVDPDGLDLVLNHLLDNAIKYTSRGAIHVTVDQSGDDAVVVVDDDGIGIPEEAHARLFDEFFRAENAKATGQVGTGLGLTIVKEVLDRHGGSIAIESAEGRGTTVTVRLPLAGSNSGVRSDK